ncbi:MAG: site-specific DNA-methyltransferase [Methylophaga sp.]|nr:site-specific DNA-methyltransferase [Methylophaga sp.]
MTEQNSLNLEETNNIESVEKYKFEPIKGYPMLNWQGKRPFTSTQYYPAQKKEVYGEEVNGWINKIFWGDNLQVMSHLLKAYRGKVKLVYIDPPFDSKADYKKKIKLKSQEIKNDSNSFEEKQYTDIWTNDEYLQFMYERLVLIRELLAKDGSIYVHCDWHKNHYLRCILDEIFGVNNFRNELIWSYFGFKRATTKKFPQKHDTILSYTKSDEYTWNVQFKPHSDEYKARFKTDENGRLYRDDVNPTGGGARIIYLDAVEGDIIDSTWSDIPPVNPVAKERQNYPTQKPEKLLERIIEASTDEGDLVLDVFMGCGTTQASALKLNRRFIGSDINLGAVQTATKRLTGMLNSGRYKTGLEIYNVNNYDVFRNPVEAKSLILEAFEIEPLSNSIYDGEKEGYMVKVMPVNRISTREDLNDLLSNFPYKVFEQRKENEPNKAVELIMLICMGHEPDIRAHLEQESGYKLDVQVVDILRDKSRIEFKRDSEAEIITSNRKLEVVNFFPMNLMQKLSLQKESVNEWRELVESIVIDWNYGGAAMEPTAIDIPAKNEFVDVFTIFLMMLVRLK